MALKKNIQESISIPTSLSDIQKEELGKRIVEEIRDRTDRGIDKNSRTFPSYSKEYGKTGTPNLRSTGDMVAELDVLKITSSTITVGYDISHPDAGQVEGNTIGSYGDRIGHPSKARDFIGLPQKVVNILVEEVRNDPDLQESGIDLQNGNASSRSTIANILNRFR